MELTAEMNAPQIDTQIIRDFLNFLGDRTSAGWSHLFITTNWDYLLQREVAKMFPREVPRWLRPDSHVYHLNGTVEALRDGSRRSPFLLEDDPAVQRNQTVEANQAFNLMIWRTVIVVVGMAFECETDRFLLSNLNRVQDEVPIGESLWVIVNPCKPVLDRVSARIQKALPGAAVSTVCRTFSQWYSTGFPELQGKGAFNG